MNPYTNADILLMRKMKLVFFKVSGRVDLGALVTVQFFLYSHVEFTVHYQHVRHALYIVGGRPGFYWPVAFVDPPVSMSLPLGL